MHTEDLGHHEYLGLQNAKDIGILWLSVAAANLPPFDNAGSFLTARSIESQTGIDKIRYDSLNRT